MKSLAAAGRGLLNRLLYFRHRQGLVGVVGLVLIGIAVAMLALPVRSIWAESSRLAVQTRVPTSEQLQSPNGANEVKTLPHQGDLTVVLSRMMQALNEQRLTVANAEYAWKANEPSASAFGEFLIRWRIQGGYVGVRRFINAVLNSERTMALREVRFTSGSRETPGLTSELTFVVHLGSAKP